LHRDIQSRHSIGMHFATFAGSDVEALEPIADLMEARDAANIGDWETEGGIGTLNIGETAIVKVKEKESVGADSVTTGDILQA
jgi:N-acyl-phosphatidylethanolamine-hydrolysing phospholipase D